VARHWEQHNTGVLRYRMRMRTNDGRVLWILRSKTIYSPGGAPLRMAGSTPTLPSRSRTGAPGSDVFESNHHQGILIVNAEGNIVSANRLCAAERLCGRGTDRPCRRQPAFSRGRAAMYAQIWQTVKRSATARRKCGAHARR
jgi:hypothetical protein